MHLYELIIWGKEVRPHLLGVNPNTGTSTPSHLANYGASLSNYATHPLRGNNELCYNWSLIRRCCVALKLNQSLDHLRYRLRKGLKQTMKTKHNNRYWHQDEKGVLIKKLLHTTN